MENQKIDIAVFQLCSELDYKKNLIKIDQAAKEATAKGVKYLFLPECFYSMSNGLEASPYLVEISNEHFQNICDIAKENEIYLLGGSVAYRSGTQVLNRALNINPQGELIGHYDKVHLFSCDLKNKLINESDIYTPGTEPKLLDLPPMKIGMGICFDVRFPEMGREYSRFGANILTYSSAFTVPTGKAHWHTLLRARAIENQAFVVAPAQWGDHNERIKTYGHSLVIGPWGDILLDAGEGEGLHIVEIDLSKIDEVRKAVKVFS